MSLPEGLRSNKRDHNLSRSTCRSLQPGSARDLPVTRLPPTRLNIFCYCLYKGEKSRTPTSLPRAWHPRPPRAQHGPGVALPQAGGAATGATPRHLESEGDLPGSPRAARSRPRRALPGQPVTLATDNFRLRPGRDGGAGRPAGEAARASPAPSPAPPRPALGGWRGPQPPAPSPPAAGPGSPGRPGGRSRLGSQPPRAPLRWGPTSPWGRVCSARGSALRPVPCSGSRCQVLHMTYSYWQLRSVG